MFKKIEISYFRKIEHRVTHFTPGLNVIRGANESSKSTMMEAAMYALYGTSVLRDSLEGAVTWGNDVKKLKVELVILDQSGTEYAFTRSKAGAEVSKAGQVFVTGQKEVSAFAATLLGADAKIATNLMLSGQNGLRGVLDEGPKATAQTIEQLANFKLIDQILDAAAEKLQLGATAVLESRAADVERELVALPAVTPPDDQALALTLHSVDYRREALVTQLTQSNVDYTQAQIHWREAVAVQESATKLERDAGQVLVQIQEIEKNLAAVQVLASTPLPDLASVEADLAAARNHASLVTKHAAFLKLPKVSSFADRAEWSKDLGSMRAGANRVKQAITTAETDIRILKAKLITETACGLCGKDLSDVPEVQAKNAATQELIDKLTEQLTNDSSLLVTFERSADAEDALVKGDANLVSRARALGDLVRIDESVIPARVTWVGGEVGEAPDIGQIERNLVELSGHKTAILKAIGQRDAYLSTLAAAKLRLEEVQNQVQALSPLSKEALEQVEADYLLKAQRVREAEDSIANLDKEVAEAKVKFAAELELYERALRERGTLEARLKDLNKDIATTAFNNTLVKKVRSARPIIGNKLWNIVLATVSQLFSRMRGVQSVVTRGTNGFLVNGNSIEGLSGSTLDLLGLAVRTALVKTFLPGCSLVTLDEPCQGCDEERTVSLLGFVAASSFDQTILITHESVSESFANNLIQL